MVVGLSPAAEDLLGIGGTFRSCSHYGDGVITAEKNILLKREFKSEMCKNLSGGRIKCMKKHRKHVVSGENNWWMKTLENMINL